MQRRPSCRPIHPARGRRLGLALFAALVAGLALASAPSSAWAHSEFERSSPAASAQLDKAPRQVRLVFNQPISAKFARLSLTVGDAKPQQLAARVSGPRVSAEVPPARQGDAAPGTVLRWTVGYRVVSADGHPIEGTIEFRAPAAVPLATASPAPSEDPSATTPEAEADAAPSSEQSSSGSDGPAILSTLVIGGFVAAVVLGFVVWLARLRRTPEQ